MQWLQRGQFFTEKIDGRRYPFLRKARDTYMVAQNTAGIECNSSASRLYYSVYQTCWQFIETNKIGKPRGYESYRQWTHLMVRKAIGERWEGFETIIDELHDLRKKADYQKADVQEYNLEEHWPEAQKVIREVRLHIDLE